jgi:hypothetical protein
MKYLAALLSVVVCVTLGAPSAVAQADDSDETSDVESEFEALQKEVSDEEGSEETTPEDETIEEQASEETTEEPASEKTTEEQASEETTEEQASEKTTEEQASGETTEEQASGETTEEQASDETTEDTASDSTDDADGTSEEDISDIEAALAADEEERETDDDGTGVSTPDSSQAVQSMNPEISLILDTTAAWFSSDDVDLRGGHDPNSFGFNLQGLELAVGATVDPYFRFDSAILFSLFGVEIEEAFITTLALPWKLQVRAGQFKTDVGRLNPTHLHSWKFVTQPLVNAKYFGGESLRGLGVEVSRLLPTPWYSEVLASVQNIGGAATGRSFAPTQQDIDGPLDLTLNTRLENFFELSTQVDLLWGLGWVTGRNHSGRGNVTDIYESDLFLRWRNVTEGGRHEVGWQTEFMLRRRQVPLTVLQDWGGSSFVYYSPSKYFEFATRYELVSGIDPEETEGNTVDPLDPNWTDLRHRGAINASWMPSHFSRLRLEYQVDYLSYREEMDADALNHQVFLQLEVVTGAHGAHDY